jgi:hypothetical protein
MTDTTDDITKRARPEQTGTPILVRLQPDQLARLDAWIEADGLRFSRPEAIRRLLEHAWGRTVASRGIRMQNPNVRLSD